MSTKIECSVCQNELEGGYCSTCGQEVKGLPITFKSVAMDIVSNVFSLERSVLATFLVLVVNPNKIITNYWVGNRRYYPSPGKVFFYSLAIAAIHLSFISQDNILGITLEVEGLQSHFFFWLIVLPFMILSSFLVYLRRNGALMKNVTSLLYLASTFLSIIIIIVDIVNYLSPNLIDLEAFAAFIILTFSWNSRVFDVGRKFWIALTNIILQIVIFAGMVTGFILLISNYSLQTIN